jgi:hypothetical protein
VSLNFSLADAGNFLRWLKDCQQPIDLDEVAAADIYTVVALATVARQDLKSPVPLRLGAGPFSRFAHAVGLETVVNGTPRRVALEPDRSVTLARFGWYEANEAGPADRASLAREVARLITSEIGTPAFDAVKYVIIELLRNVAQHSDDPIGGVLAAQVIERPGVSRRVQVAVGDAGIGLLEAVTSRRHHPGVTDIQMALEKALHPHFSGTFPEGQTGTQENAGLGLYVLSELAKITGGSFLLASRGDALLVRSVDHPQGRATFLDHGGFPGTLVVFECVLENLQDFRSVFRTIKDRANTRRPGRITSGVVKFVDAVPTDARRFLVSVASEDTGAAVAFAKQTLLPRVSSGEAVALDFVNWSVFSQSYLHALLYVVVRVAWATKATVYVLNASPVVRSGIEWIESYALVG